MNQIKAFVKGMREFRCSVTVRYADLRLRTAYDSGRDLAHRLTFRKFDQ
jgi:hypothetical protein